MNVFLYLKEQRKKKKKNSYVPFFCEHVLWSPAFFPILESLRRPLNTFGILLINYFCLLWICVWFGVGWGSKNLVIGNMLLSEVPTGPLSCAWLIKYGTRNIPVYKIIHALKNFGKLV